MDVITTHVNADFDCIGGMVAARKLYPDALMVFSGSQEKTVRDFFQRFPHLLPLFTRARDVDLERVTRLVLVDCQHSSRIARFAEILGREGLEIDVYDHHPESAGDIGRRGGIIRECGSSTTILTKLVMERNLEVSPDEATMMLLGIYEDTGRLTFPTTTTDDFLAAAWLRERGGDLNVVADFLTQELTTPQVALLNDLLKSLRTVTVNDVEVSVCHAAVDYYIGDIAVLAHMIRDMENLEALFVVVDMGKRIFVIARSRIPEVDVGDILRQVGGGGHATAAAATVKDASLIETLSRIEELLRERVNPRRTARSIMSSPVKTIDASATTEEAREALVRYNVNAMPVLRRGKMVGIISRQTAEKAVYHRLGTAPVTDYMHTEFLRATPDTPINDIHEYIVGHNRRFVPVFDGERLVGAITRTDLLRYLYAGMRESGVYELSGDELPRRRKGLEHLMTRNLPPRVLGVLRDLGDTADRHDLPVFAVGGFVRDLLLGNPNTDIDVTVEGDGILFAEDFAARFGCRVKSHRAFNTAVVIFPDGFKIDVASTRLEYYETPAALPTVEHSSLKMDMYRRDFTINTMAIQLNRRDFGTLIDYFGAQRDLADRVIRVLHNLSFVEDPTRVFRAIRFELKLGFHISGHTENLIRNAVRMNFLQRLGGKRLLTELVLVLREADPLTLLERLHSLDLLRIIHPELRLCKEMRRIMEESVRAVTWFELLFLDERCEKWVVYFLALTDLLPEEEFHALCTRLAVAEHYRERLSEGRREGRGRLNELTRRLPSGLANSDIYFMLRDLPPEVLLYLMAKSSREEVKKTFSLYFTHLRGARSAIGGEDLKRMGLSPGPCFRQILERVTAARLDGASSTREDDLRVAAEEMRRCSKYATVPAK